MVTAPERAEVALGNPSFVWRFGQDRRLGLIRRYAPLEGARVLDIGCGLGVYVRKFREFTDQAFGIDIDAKRLRDGALTTPDSCSPPASSCRSRMLHSTSLY